MKETKVCVSLSKLTQTESVMMIFETQKNDLFQGIGANQWQLLFGGLSKNDHVESLTAANCDISDTIAQLICDCLNENQSLRFLTLDSNSISGEMILKLIQTTSRKKVLEELRVSNQVKENHRFHFQPYLNQSAILVLVELQIFGQSNRNRNIPSIIRNATISEARFDHGVSRHFEPHSSSTSEELGSE